VDGVPVIVPVEELIDSPPGRPVADQVMVAPESVSVALEVTGVTAEPVRLDWFPGLVTLMVEEMPQVNEVDPVKPAVSVAVMVTEKTPAVVGVPVTDPVEELIERPAGRPEVVQVKDWPDWVSVAELVNVLMAVPAGEVRLDLDKTATVLVVVHVSAAEPACPVLSEATIRTEAEPGVVGVPVIVPLEALIDRPAGSPVADQVIVTPISVSVALDVSGVMAEPVVLVWLPGLATVIDEVRVQVNEVLPTKEFVSVAYSTTA